MKAVRELSMLPQRKIGFALSFTGTGPECAGHAHDMKETWCSGHRSLFELRLVDKNPG
jgi:hypothetical protein